MYVAFVGEACAELTVRIVVMRTGMRCVVGSSLVLLVLVRVDLVFDLDLDLENRREKQMRKV